MFELKIVVGSTRPARAADPVADWITRRAQEHGAFNVEQLDLRDWPLPFFSESLQTVGDIKNPTYSDPLVKKWNETIVAGDAFIFITPEYNHSFSGVLKNAIDSVFMSWGLRNKPAGMVSYSGGIIAGARAVEQLALVVVEAEMVPLRNSVLIGALPTAFGPDGNPLNTASEAAATILLDDLAWWADALNAARAKGELRPGGFRLRELTRPPAN